MKKKLLLSLSTLLILCSCGNGIVAHNTFFNNTYLENLNLYNMPILKVENTRRLGNSFFHTITEDGFESYASELFTYLIERESMKYVLYKGEKNSDLLDDTYNRYNVYASKNIEDYKVDNGYEFIFSFSPLNKDNSLSMGFTISLEYYSETQYNQELGNDFTFNSIMDISGIDKPQYLFYKIK